MFSSENNDLRRSGEEKLKEIAAIWAERKGASLIGLMLKEKQKEVFESKNNDYFQFLNTQRGVTNTKKLATLLQKRFEINSFRSCEDVVRAWKKNLRSAGGP